MQIQSVIRLLYTIIYQNLYNIEEMIKFLKRYNIPRLAEEEIIIGLFRFSTKGIESVIEIQQTKAQDLTYSVVICPKHSMDI